MSSSSSSLRFACSFASCSSRILSLRSVALFVLTFELISLRATLRFVAFDRFDAPDRCDAIEPTTDTASPSFSAAAWAVLSFSAAARAVLVGGAPLAEAPPNSLKLSRSTLFSLSTRSRQQSEYCCAVILNGCGARDRQGLSGAGARWASARPVCASRGLPWWMLRVFGRVDQEPLAHARTTENALHAGSSCTAGAELRARVFCACVSFRKRSWNSRKIR